MRAQSVLASARLVAMIASAVLCLIVVVGCETYPSITSKPWSPIAPPPPPSGAPGILELVRDEVVGGSNFESEYRLSEDGGFVFMAGGYAGGWSGCGMCMGYGRYTLLDTTVVLTFGYLGLRGSWSGDQVKARLRGDSLVISYPPELTQVSSLYRDEPYVSFGGPACHELDRGSSTCWFAGQRTPSSTAWEKDP